MLQGHRSYWLQLRGAGWNLRATFLFPLSGAETEPPVRQLRYQLGEGPLLQTCSWTGSDGAGAKASSLH